MKRSTNDRNRLIAGLAVMFEAYHKQASEVTYKAYEMALEDYSIEKIESAIKRAIKTCKFCPSTAELCQLCGSHSDADRAIIAWQAVLKAVPLGGWKSITFDDRVVNATIRSLGGWPTFLERFKSTKDEEFARKDFIATYQSISRSNSDIGSAGDPLPGLSQKQVINGKLAKPIPHLIQTNLDPLPIGMENKSGSKSNIPSIELKRVK